MSDEIFRDMQVHVLAVGSCSILLLNLQNEIIGNTTESDLGGYIIESE